MTHRIATALAGVVLFFVALVLADAGRSRLSVTRPQAARADTVTGLVMLTGLEPVPEGRTAAPDFTLDRLGGGTVRLADLSGRVVLLNFWATWCPPCRAEMPSMERLYQTYRDRGLIIVAIDYRERPTQVSPFVTELGLTFPVAFDRDGTVTDTRYPTGGLPTTYLIDRRGRAVARKIGFADWDSGSARALVEALLAEPVSAPAAGMGPGGG